MELHQRRHESLYQYGCFTSSAFYRFLSEVVDHFCGTDHLYLGELAIDGQMAAAAVGLLFDNVNYIYQCGMSPDLAHHSPGWLMNIFVVEHAIRNRLTDVDYLCGDEPYKARLGARPVPMVQLSVTARRPLARIRHQLCLGGERFVDWIRPTQTAVAADPVKS